jgi:pSer/pThr/pTyr-binding forkhead associated (FHA) protein
MRVQMGGTFIMGNCPFCGAETRPGDNFCLNCGNRLLSATPSASPQQQAQPIIGDATLAAPDDWGAAVSQEGGTAPASGWDSDDSATVASSSDQATYRPDSAGAAPTSGDNIEQPARFILRSESGEVLQEYPLDKSEVVVGRAPSSDILLSKDKLTSRRHATIRYENGQYLLRDERSANGTFVNGQQIEEGVPRILQEGDHVGIGEHELIFRTFESPASSLEELQTVVVPFDHEEKTFRTQPDDLATVASSDDFGTRPVEMSEEEQPAPTPVTFPPVPATPLAVEPAVASLGNGFSAASAPVSSSYEDVPSTPAPTPSIPVSVPVSTPAASSAPLTPPPPPPTPVAEPVSPPPPVYQEYTPERSNSLPPAYQDYAPERSISVPSSSDVTFNRLTSLSQPSLPDLTNLIAALSSLDGQITTLQQQFNATQDAMRNHEAELNQTTSQLRSGIRRVSERMDNTIADVARSREALAWADLLQLMEDVMNNPRDIEYVTKLARKARELNKVFQIHQNVLNAMAECNSLLRSMIGEDK